MNKKHVFFSLQEIARLLLMTSTITGQFWKALVSFFHMIPTCLYRISKAEAKEKVEEAAKIQTSFP